MALKKSRSSCWDLFTNYIFFLWDGLGFFGFDGNKLDRLKGIKPRWYDPFFNKGWILNKLIILAIMVYVLNGNFEKLGDIKSQTLNKEKGSKYTFEVQN